VNLMVISSEFQATVDWLESLTKYPLVSSELVGLRRIELLLEQVGNPHHSFRAVHIAGSSGKGSTAGMCASILSAAGYRTGYFQSPHLVDYRERMSVDGSLISKQEWITCFEHVRPSVEWLLSQSNELGRPALFEVLFVVAALYFQNHGVEWAILEAGLGGRLDATNAVTPAVTAITNISLEHTQVLGSTVKAIAKEKAAIIKNHLPCVTAATGPALEVIETRAKDQHAPLTRIGTDIDIAVRRSTLQEQAVTFYTGDREITATLHTLGDFQVRNAAVSVGIARALQRIGFRICDSAIVEGLQAIRMPGRFEVVDDAPLVILDGAHNADAMSHLADAVTTVPELGLPIVVVLAMMADKNIDEMLAQVTRMTQSVVVVNNPGTSRSASRETLARACMDRDMHVEIAHDVEDGLFRARQVAGRDGTVLVTGSMYLVGAARTALRSRVCATI